MTSAEQILHKGAIFIDLSMIVTFNDFFLVTHTEML